MRFFKLLDANIFPKIPNYSPLFCPALQAKICLSLSNLSSPISVVQEISTVYSVKE